MRSLILSVFFLCISESESVKTLRNVAVKSGGSLTIPCFYDEQYKSNPKYWCKGYYWRSCGIVVRTNTSGRTSVTDNPTQNMFTVELNSLQDSDSGYYWCAVEIGDKWTIDDGDYLYLTVSAEPAVSVINSRVSGQEGGSVSVQCLYRTDYKNKQKQWCRFRDWSCLTSQNSAVQISDDGRGSVSVEMSGLKKSDAGWYWFSAGDVGVTVQLFVTNTTKDNNIKDNEIQESHYNGTILALSIISGLFLLLTMVGVVIWKCGQKSKTKGGSHISHLSDVTYAKMFFSTEGSNQRDPNQLSQVEHDDKVTYSSLNEVQ